MKNKKLKRMLYGILAIPLTLAVIFIIAGCMPQKDLVTPSGYKQTQSIYVTMKDGTKIGVRVTLPENLKKNEKIPTIMESTRYSTGYQLSFVSNAFVNLGIMKDDMPIIIRKFLNTNHAYVYVQARGSGISFGKREIEFSKEEIEDYGQILDWIVKQDWSNGKVGTYGISYMSNTAELSTSLSHPALKAAALLYGDFNPVSNTTLPGGLFSSNFLKRFRDGTAQDDNNSLENSMIDGLLPVDKDKDGKLLNQAIAGHKNNYDVYECIKKVTYYDDILSGAYTANDMAPYNYKKQIEESRIPLYVRIGWQDAATVNGALERYLTYSNNQTLVIGPWNHGGSSFWDPLSDKKILQQKLLEEQADEVITFLDQYIKDDTKTIQNSTIKYYTFGEGKWKTSDKWPIEGMDTKVLYFGSNGTLNENKPNAITGSDTYQIDFTATTGNTNRWQTNYGGGPVRYPDRQNEDKKLLTYTSEAFQNDVEITGIPVVTLNLSSTATDGAFITYLEEVAPDGTVTYLTEGELRGIHRKISKENPGHVVLGPNHSFKRQDGALLIPGETTEIKIGMQATSVLIKKGHKIRIAIAGSDDSTFDRIAENEHPVIEVQRNNIVSSNIELPLKVIKN